MSTVRLFMNGKTNKWNGVIFPSVLVLLLVISSLFYLELDLYKKQQELSTLSVRLYEGKVLTDLAFRKAVYLNRTNDETVGTLNYNVGSVKYRVKGDEIRLSIYIGEDLIFDVKEKMPTKKAIL